MSPHSSESLVYMHQAMDLMRCANDRLRCKAENVELCGTDGNLPRDNDRRVRSRSAGSSTAPSGSNGAFGSALCDQNNKLHVMRKLVMKAILV